MDAFDCSEVFPKVEHADCVVIGNSARIRLWEGHSHTHLVIDVDKISNFLERCRQQQEPRIRHLA
jgi:hypothetical protein